MIFNKLGLSALAATFLLGASVASAAGGGGMGYAGVGAGWGIPMSAPGASGGFAMAANGGYFVIPGVAAELSFGWNHLGNSTAGVSTNVLQYLAGASYWIPQVAGLHVGADVGMATSKAKAGTLSASSTDFAFGAKAGYDYLVAVGLTVGLGVNWLMVMTTDKYALLNFMVPVRYNF